MKKEIIVTLFAVVASLMCLIAYMGYRCGVASVRKYHIVSDTTTFVDTITYYKPVPKDSAVVRYVTRYLPVAKQKDTLLAGNYAQKDGEIIPPHGLSDESDSMAVEIPITQKVYKGEEYRTYVSGYEPHLDSIFVFPKTTMIREMAYKPTNKWHLGITGGYGYGFKSQQMEPYIGIGITYSIISF